ncbi:MAG: PatU [Cyanobacteria bacterium Co-bin13]|nr:PatU [Cyanobacteria bacterium Co-bin13]
MKRDTEIIRDILLWLLTDPKPADSTSSGTPLNVSLSEATLSGDVVSGEVFSREGRASTSDDSWDPFESEAFAVADLDPGLIDPGALPHPVSLGEIPAVQDRFQALIKRRLRLEIERRPPRFPWEQGIQDYPEWLMGEAPMAPVWIEQLRQLKLPTLLPDEVLVTLLEHCQDLAQQPLKSGVRLIKAVEVLFPGQPQTLENMARLVLTPAYRSGRTTEPVTLDYESANTQQQVALAMLAAQEIFQSLTLTVSAQEPTVQRQWLTPMGPLTLTATYQAQETDRIQVRAVLPQAGYLHLEDVRAERDQPGELVAVLEAPQANQSYPVTVGLLESQSPLQFTLIWSEGLEP